VRNAVGWVASVCNHLRAPQTVTLAGHGGKAITDLLTGRTLDTSFTADPHDTAAAQREVIPLPKSL
jgi:hypothetical protein